MDPENQNHVSASHVSTSLTQATKSWHISHKKKESNAICEKDLLSNVSGNMEAVTVAIRKVKSSGSFTRVGSS